ncbi:hypothetical protein EVAR_56151_1 [Eumeta japonica]|uniref:Uncharacterized protein n=1 Tax=Eumeta variegata TaxID=151549 RepID=A0A4C1Y6D6_EUMVA|nr:hypothetical protein EVAR_56151_1 [Eumeta japonica]
MDELNGDTVHELTAVRLKTSDRDVTRSYVYNEHITSGCPAVGAHNRRTACHHYHRIYRGQLRPAGIRCYSSSIPSTSGTKRRHVLRSIFEAKLYIDVIDVVRRHVYAVKGVAAGGGGCNAWWFHIFDVAH